MWDSLYSSTSLDGHNCLINSNKIPGKKRENNAGELQHMQEIMLAFNGIPPFICLQWHYVDRLNDFAGKRESLRLRRKNGWNEQCKILSAFLRSWSKNRLVHENAFNISNQTEYFGSKLFMASFWDLSFCENNYFWKLAPLHQVQ